MLNILAAILLFGFIVMFHELGHFLLPGEEDQVFLENFALGRILRHGGRGFGQRGSQRVFE